MQSLPPDVVAYRSTKTFTQDTVPAGLRSDHTIIDGIWGLLVVESGEITYVVTELGFEEEIIIWPGSPGVIAPGQRHHVRPLGDGVSCGVPELLARAP